MNTHDNQVRPLFFRDMQNPFGWELEVHGGSHLVPIFGFRRNQIPQLFKGSLCDLFLMLRRYHRDRVQ